MTRGFKGPHSEKTKKLISQKNKGRHFSPANEFKKGCIPWNKGLKRRGLKYAYHNNSKTKFKPGNRPKNWLPVGTVTIRLDSGKNNMPYHWIKIAEPTKWMPLARLIWKLTRGREIPQGFIIYHLDGITLNDSPENLACIPRSLHIKFLKLDHETFEINRIINTRIAQKNRWQKYRQQLALGIT